MIVMVETSTTTLPMKCTLGLYVESIVDAWATSEVMKKWLFTIESTNKIANSELNVGGT